MTDRALDDLIADVDAGDWGLDWTAIVASGLNATYCEVFTEAYHGSLDAAKSLHEALLPGWMPALEMLTDRNWLIHLWSPGGGPCEVSSENACPARCWLIAILRAYRGMQG